MFNSSIIFSIERVTKVCHREYVDPLPFITQRGMRSQEDPGGGEAPSSSSCHVLEGWQQTADARRYVNALLKRNKRKTFGMHTTPSAAPKHSQHSGLCLHMLKVWDCGLSMLGHSLVPTLCFVRAGEGKRTKRSLTPSPPTRCPGAANVGPVQQHATPSSEAAPHGQGGRGED